MRYRGRFNGHFVLGRRMSPVSKLHTEIRAPQILWDMFGMGKLSTQSPQEKVMLPLLECYKHRRCLINRYINHINPGYWGRGLLPFPSHRASFKRNRLEIEPGNEERVNFFCLTPIFCPFPCHLPAFSLSLSAKGTHLHSSATEGLSWGKRLRSPSHSRGTRSV